MLNKPQFTYRKNALDCLTFLDLAKYISGNGELPSIPSPVPGLDFVIDIMVTETKERMKEMWDEAVEHTLEKAKDLGTKGVKEFINLNANADKKYTTIEASQDTLEKLLSGKIRKNAEGHIFAQHSMTSYSLGFVFDPESCRII